MTERALYLDEGPGERRAVVCLGDAPERLFIERPDVDYPRLGARYLARVARVDRGLGLAWLDLGEDGEASLRLKADRPPPGEGAKIEVEIGIEPQGVKPAVARWVGEGAGAPRRLAAAPGLEERLQSFAPAARIRNGRPARDVAEEAEAAALTTEFALPGGGSLAIEATRALTAVDVDVGAAGRGDAKRVARQVNLRAIAECARLLRLRAQGGLVVLDLVGRGHDGQALAQALRAAFAPDQPGAAFGAVSRFGLIELALPRRFRPLSDLLCDANGEPSAQTLAFRLVRAIEREALADPGGRFLALAGAEAVEAASSPVHALLGRIGARFEVRAEPGLAREGMEIRRL